MNFEDYERRQQATYAEFVAVVRDILVKVIAATDGVSSPQSIQCRAKDAARLKPKLQDRGLLDSQSIETEIKDLAGIRLIFYTNTDVDRFLNSQLIPGNFEVDWDETRIHHSVGEDTRQRYQAIHYTVRLNRARLDLAEYAKFSGMRCEIQIQTILNHAWAETSHDILYKPQVGQGFGSKALEDIEKRMARIMDEYLLPAGYSRPTGPNRHKHSYSDRQGRAGPRPNPGSNELRRSGTDGSQTRRWRKESGANPSLEQGPRFRR